jgi:hypothetical protein
MSWFFKSLIVQTSEEHQKQLDDLEAIKRNKEIEELRESRLAATTILMNERYGRLEEASYRNLQAFQLQGQMNQVQTGYNPTLTSQAIINGEQCHQELGVQGYYNQSYANILGARQLASYHQPVVLGLEYGVTFNEGITGQLPTLTREQLEAFWYNVYNDRPIKPKRIKSKNGHLPDFF